MGGALTQSCISNNSPQCEYFSIKFTASMVYLICMQVLSYKNTLTPDSISSSFVCLNVLRYWIVHVRFFFIAMQSTLPEANSLTDDSSLLPSYHLHTHFPQ